MFTKYEHVKAYFSTCRDKKKGKPLLTPYLITQNGQDFEFRLRYSKNSDIVFAIVRPDDTMEFTLTTEKMRVWSNTLCMTFHKVFPVEFRRVATGRYKLILTETLPKWADYQYKPTNESHLAFCTAATSAVKAASEAFSGLRIHLPTSTYVNPKFLNAENADKDKASEWRKLVTKFKRQMKVRAKLGTFTKINEEVLERRRKSGTWSRPDWADSEWQSLLYNAITKGEYPKEFLDGIAETSATTYYYSTNPSDIEVIVRTVDEVYKASSLYLRNTFGVFSNAMQSLSDQDEVRGHQME